MTQPEALDSSTEERPHAALGVERSTAEAVMSKEQRALYAKRVKVYPKKASGAFRRLKWLIMALTLTVYYGAPWIRWDRGPNAPDQAILLDLPARRFYFFFIEIWPQEVYYVTGLLILAAVGLFLVTALAGRVWCGYTCPQTVWTDLFIAVERFFEGDRAARVRHDKMPWTTSKVLRKSAKHVSWLLVGMLTGGAWVFYFADAPQLLLDLVTLEAPAVAYITIAVLTFTTYLFGGHAREQVCIYMCPWPRIQATMLDEDSLTVTYRAYRGEPRGPRRKGQTDSGTGHCVDCNQCVAVCPMGIDIRDGQQLECITCALCIDACNSVMDKVDLPRGLIAYDTLANVDRRSHGEQGRIKLLRLRPLIYLGIMVIVGLVMLVTLVTRSDADLNVLHDRNPLFVTLSDGGLRNGYTVKVLNKQHAERRFALSLRGLEKAEISVVGQPAGDVPELAVKPDRLASYRVFVSVPPDGFDAEARDIVFVATDRDSGVEVSTGSIFRGPAR